MLYTLMVTTATATTAKKKQLPFLGALSDEKKRKEKKNKKVQYSTFNFQDKMEDFFLERPNKNSDKYQWGLR